MMVPTGHTIFHFNGTFSSRLNQIQEYQILGTVVVSTTSIELNRKSVQFLEEWLSSLFFPCDVVKGNTNFC